MKAATQLPLRPTQRVRSACRRRSGTPPPARRAETLAGPIGSDGGIDGHDVEMIPAQRPRCRVRASPGHVRVQRSASQAAEALRLGLFDELAKAAGSRAASSARLLRSSSMPAVLRPFMKHAVGQAVFAGGGVDAHDPQAAVVALLALAADVCVDARLFGRLSHELVKLALVLEVALGEFESFLRF